MFKQYKITLAHPYSSRAFQQHPELRVPWGGHGLRNLNMTNKQNKLPQEIHMSSCETTAKANPKRGVKNFFW